jgi:hypothetical protein
MSDVNRWQWEKSAESLIPVLKEFETVANDLCEKSLNDAKTQLHPLLWDAELDLLDQRDEFLQGFKTSLEQRIARTLAAWQPGIQAVFKFDGTPVENTGTWDGSIHLLVKIPHLSNAVKALGRRLDESLMRHLKQLGWSRFQKQQSILNVQQVTPNELRHGVGYGAMFYAVYTAPVKIWPQDR